MPGRRSPAACRAEASRRDRRALPLEPVPRVAHAATLGFGRVHPRGAGACAHRADRRRPRAPAAAGRRVAAGGRPVVRRPGAVGAHPRRRPGSRCRTSARRPGPTAYPTDLVGEELPDSPRLERAWQEGRASAGATPLLGTTPQIRQETIPVRRAAGVIAVLSPRHQRHRGPGDEPARADLPVERRRAAADGRGGRVPVPGLRPRPRARAPRRRRAAAAGPDRSRRLRLAQRAVGVPSARG